MSRVVLDTSALLFWTLAPERLSARARTAIDGATPFGWLASAISLWEIGLKVQRGQLSLGVTFAILAIGVVYSLYKTAGPANSGNGSAHS